MSTTLSTSSYIPCPPNVSIGVYAELEGNGCVFKVICDAYTKAKVAISTVSSGNQTIGRAGVVFFRECGFPTPATTAFIRISVVKISGAGSLFVHRLGITQMKPMFKALLFSSDQTITASGATETTLAFKTSGSVGNSDFTGDFDNASNSFVVRRPGPYLFQASVVLKHASNAIVPAYMVFVHSTGTRYMACVQGTSVAYGGSIYTLLQGTLGPSNIFGGAAAIAATPASLLVKIWTTTGCSAIYNDGNWGPSMFCGEMIKGEYP
jgi:hypothetical protein